MPSQTQKGSHSTARVRDAIANGDIRQMRVCCQAAASFGC